MSGPGFSHELRQRQTQSLVLAPQLRHSLKILQVAALDLRSVIQEELQNNPTLEELPMEEIARSLGAPVTTCYSRLYAAREAVQAGLRRRERFTNPVRKEISQ